MWGSSSIRAPQSSLFLSNNGETRSLLLSDTQQQSPRWSYRDLVTELLLPRLCHKDLTECCHRKKCHRASVTEKCQGASVTETESLRQCHGDRVTETESRRQSHGASVTETESWRLKWCLKSVATRDKFVLPSTHIYSLCVWTVSQIQFHRDSIKKSESITETALQMYSII